MVANPANALMIPDWMTELVKTIPLSTQKLGKWRKLFSSPHLTRYFKQEWKSYYDFFLWKVHLTSNYEILNLRIFLYLFEPNGNLFILKITRWKTERFDTCYLDCHNQNCKCFRPDFWYGRMLYDLLTHTSVHQRILVPGKLWSESLGGYAKSMDLYVYSEKVFEIFEKRKWCVWKKSKVIPSNYTLKSVHFKSFENWIKLN